MSDTPRVEVLPIEAGATPDPMNTNAHTQRGGGLLENSLRRRGANRSIASAGKGVDVPVVTAGNFTLEKAYGAGFTEIVNIHVTGNQLVNVVRDDIAPGSPEAVALGIEDNEIGKQSYNPDVDILAALTAGDSALLKTLKDEDEIFSSMVDGMLDNNVFPGGHEEIEGMPLLPDEKYDYVVLAFTKQSDFDEAITILGLKQLRDPRSGWAQHVGLCRVIDGTPVIRKLSK